MTDGFQREKRKPVLGITRHAQRHELDPNALWRMENAELRDGQLCKVGGWGAAFHQLVLPGTQTPAGPVSLIQTIQYGTSQYRSLAGTDRYIYQVDANKTALNAEAYPVNPLRRWKTALLGGKLFFTAADQSVRYLDNDTINLLGGEPPRGATLASFMEHLVLGDLRSTKEGDAHDSFMGSGLRDPENWDVNDPASDADLWPLEGRGDRIQHLGTLGDYLVAYKEWSIHIARYVGLPSVYVLDTPSSAMGAVSPHAVVSTRLGDVFLGQDNLYVFDGAALRPFGERVWNHLSTLFVDAANLKIAWGFHHFAKAEVYWVTDAGIALVWNYKYDSFSTRTFPFTAAGYMPKDFPTLITELGPIVGDAGSSWALGGSLSQNEYRLVVGDAAGRLYTLDDGEEKAGGSGGTALTMTLESGWSNFGSDRVKLCGGVDVELPELTGANPLQCYVCARRSLADAETWSGPYNYTDGSKGIDFRVSGVWFGFKFVKTGGTAAMASYSARVKDWGRR